MRIKVDQLKRIFPFCKADGWVVPLNNALERFGILDRNVIAAFLAQVGAESAELNHLHERLRYTAERLVQVWPRRFPTIDSARAYSNNPKALANHVYANRMGNGNTASGDGYRYRGRGLIQLTGRNNYDRIGKRLGLDLIADPGLLLDPTNAAKSACVYWVDSGLNHLSDSGDFRMITIRINGGVNGYSDRKEKWEAVQRSMELPHP